ncbi:hypothetical protein F4803DRAFT_527997 [Xylaria telfairii]|nr:hypothetical protein F4803DRAFT_527997 [Xylaria telfairii]
MPDYSRGCICSATAHLWVVTVTERLLSAFRSASRGEHTSMDIIDNFITIYHRERDEWGQLKDTAINICIAGLRDIGVAGNVTGRVKTGDSLVKKLRKRGSIKAYRDHKAIMDDQLDFVGLRIALYFPDQKEYVIRMLKDKFLYQSMRPFERDWKPHEPGIYQNMFGQYTADHVWVCLHEENRSPAGKYAKCRFEIQLRSVLMDAWAGISHDLEYKALSGDLTVTELKLLDALKGHVEVGEMMLEQLHRVHRKRIDTENETINSPRELGEILVDSIPDSQLANTQIGDLDALLVVLKAMNADTSRGFRALLSRLDVKAQLREDVERWQRQFQPVPATVASYLVEKMLPHLSTQRDKFCAIAFRVRNLRPRAWYDSRYWQPLLWLSRELMRSQELPHLSFKDSHIRKYVHIWCAEFYLRTTVPDTNDDTCVAECLSRTQECSAPGLQFLAELCVLGLAPTAPEYVEEHDEPDYQDDRFEVVASFMIHTYSSDPKAWLQGIYDFGQSLYDLDVSATDKFFRSTDIALWLMSLHEKDLLGLLLRYWPFHDRLYGVHNHERQEFCAKLSKLTESHRCQEILRPLEGDEKGYHMLDVESINPEPVYDSRRCPSLIYPSRPKDLST